MNNKKDRLLVPEDFVNSVQVFTVANITEVSGPSILQQENIPNNQKLVESKEEINDTHIPILNCLIPNTFSFYNCFTKNSNSNLTHSKNISKIEYKSTDITNYVNAELSDLLQKKANVFYSEDAEKSCRSFLLTPDNFLTVTEPEDNAIFPSIPQVLLEANKSSNDKSNLVQNNCCIYNVFASNCDNSDINISKKDSAVICSDNEYHCNNKELNKQPILTPDCFVNNAVRRKLNFDTIKIREIKSPTRTIKPNELNTIIKETPISVKDKIKRDEIDINNYPKFSCSLDIISDSLYKASDSLYEDLSVHNPNNIFFNSLTNGQNNLSLNSTSQRKPPPIGVFWDIENCQVPKGLSATHVVQAVRNRFFEGYYEAEFVCVCDTVKENSKVLEELNDAQVNIMHVGSVMKNAADDKLLQSMRRFADIHGSGATIVLISGDSDFATELYDLRYRKNLHIILVHNAFAQDSLKLSAHETVLFSDVTHELPRRPLKPHQTTLSRDIVVGNLPQHFDASQVRRRLGFLASNCGGKKIYLSDSQNWARISFHTPELAARAKKRIEGEDVFGNTVNCSFGKSRSDKCHQRHKPNNNPDHYNQKPFYWRDSEKRRNSISNLDSVRSPSREEIRMDIGSKNYWNKSSISSGSNNMNENCTNMWRIASPSFATNGHSFNSSPAFNSSESSSRDTSPSVYLHNEMQGTSYYSHSPGLPMMNTCRTQSGSDLRAYDHIRSQKVSSHQWPDNRMDSFSHANYQADQTFGLNNLSLADTTQESLSSMSQMPVELLITNLDQNIDAREMKKILLAWFRELVMVLHVSVFVQSDGYLAATVTIPSHLDAQYAISQLHRKRIGTKRINISCITHSPQPPELKRSKVLTLLKEVPGRKLPLFKFRELYERRYQETIGVSEMYNMRDLISVSDNTTGRMVCLNSEFDSLHSFMGDSSLQDPDELRYCKIHSKGPDKSVGWAERDHSAILPEVSLTLKDVSNAIKILLKSHSGNIPLASLVECYHAEVGPLEEESTGVPLEHLISCLSGVCIITGPGGFKYVKKNESKVSFDPEDLARYVSPPLVGHLALFSRELVDLLKTFPHCRMLLSRFIPAYHHHFGRQCRVADYGYTKLADLLASLPHLIQIMGEGNKRTLTLSHRVQIKRFSSDLLRVLKGQPSKMITLEAFPEAYEKVMTRMWDVTDYGVCDIMDLLREIQETTVVLKNVEEGILISIPKREQTAEEIERTRLFATEVIELLRHSPQCKMQFNRFIPAYHHHFGRQCRLSDYGFSKLIELFEAIPEVLQILGEDEEGERILQLVEKERLRILGDQIFTLVKNSPNQMIGVSALAAVFMHYYGYSLKPSNYECEDFSELLGKLRNYVKIEDPDSDGERKVTLVDRSLIDDLWSKTREILWEEPKCFLKMAKFVDTYVKKFDCHPDIKILKKDLQEYLEIKGEGDEEEIRLVPVQLFARDLLILLNEAGGRMLLMNFESSYLNRFEVACRPANLGFPNLTALLQSFNDFISIKGKRSKRIIVLNKDKVPDLPHYIPSIPQPKVETKEKSKWSNVVCPPVPPPTLHNKFAQPQQFTQNRISPPPPTPPCDQKLYKDISSGSHLIMGLTSPPQQTFQSHSPVIYSGSPAGPNGSVVWGQVWSPQYSVMPPLSPAHYMMPTIPINWGNMPSLPLHNQSNMDEGDMLRGRPPVSIQTLEHFGKGIPPSANELPSPEYLTANNGDTVERFFPELGDEDARCFSSKNFAKKRLAAQFDSRE